MATAKQLAARARFAEMARSGAFKKKAARKSNPLREKTHSYLVYSRKGDVIGSGLTLPEAKAVHKRNEGSEIYVNRESGQMIRTVPYVAKARKKNPAKRKTAIARTGVTKTEYVKRPSQITRKAPTKRLAARRKQAVGAKAKAGYFPNPKKLRETPKGEKRLWLVQVTATGRTIAQFFKKAEALQYACAYADAHKTQLGIRQSSGLREAFMQNGETVIR